MILRDLRDLPDADLLDRLPYCGREGVLIGAELARRLSNLRKHLSEALVGWDETCDKLDAAEVERDRLREAMELIAEERAPGATRSIVQQKIARAALAARKEKG